MSLNVLSSSGWVLHMTTISFRYQVPRWLGLLGILGKYEKGKGIKTHSLLFDVYK